MINRLVEETPDGSSPDGPQACSRREMKGLSTRVVLYSAYCDVHSVVDEGEVLPLPVPASDSDHNQEGRSVLARIRQMPDRVGTKGSYWPWHLQQFSVPLFEYCRQNGGSFLSRHNKAGWKDMVVLLMDTAFGGRSSSSEVVVDAEHSSCLHVKVPAVVEAIGRENFREVEGPLSRRVEVAIDLEEVEEDEQDQEDDNSACSKAKAHRSSVKMVVIPVTVTTYELKELVDTPEFRLRIVTVGASVDGLHPEKMARAVMETAAFNTTGSSCRAATATTTSFLQLPNGERRNLLQSPSFFLPTNCGDHTGVRGTYAPEILQQSQEIDAAFRECIQRCLGLWRVECRSPLQLERTSIDETTEPIWVTVDWRGLDASKSNLNFVLASASHKRVAVPVADVVGGARSRSSRGCEQPVPEVEGGMQMHPQVRTLFRLGRRALCRATVMNRGARLFVPQVEDQPMEMLGAEEQGDLTQPRLLRRCAEVAGDAIREDVERHLLAARFGHRLDVLHTTHQHHDDITKTRTNTKTVVCRDAFGRAFDFPATRQAERSTGPRQYKQKRARRQNKLVLEGVRTFGEVIAHFERHYLSEVGLRFQQPVRADRKDWFHLRDPAACNDEKAMNRGFGERGAADLNQCSSLRRGSLREVERAEEAAGGGAGGGCGPQCWRSSPDPRRKSSPRTSPTTTAEMETSARWKASGAPSTATPTGTTAPDSGLLFGSRGSDNGIITRVFRDVPIAEIFAEEELSCFVCHLDAGQKRFGRIWK